MTNTDETLPDRDPCPDLPGPDPDADLEIVCAACLARPPAPRDTLCVECRRVDDAQPLGPRPAAPPGHARMSPLVKITDGKWTEYPPGTVFAPRPTTHGQLVEEIARLREGCRKILARALRELTCAPGEEAPRTALRAILDLSKELAEG